MNMQTFLREEPPSYYSDKGLQCAFPYREIEILCALCHHPLVSSVGIVSCHACTQINQWLFESTQALERAKSRLKTPIKIEVISNIQFFEEAT